MYPLAPIINRITLFDLAVFDQVLTLITYPLYRRVIVAYTHTSRAGMLILLI